MLARPPVSRKPGRSARYLKIDLYTSGGDKIHWRTPLGVHYVLREIDQMRRCHSRWTTAKADSLITCYASRSPCGGYPLFWYLLREEE